MSKKLKIENLELSVKDKDTLIEEQTEKIKTLKEDKKELRKLIKYWKDKFLADLKLVRDKLFGKKEEREKYIEFAYELHNKKIIETEVFDEMYDFYEEIEKYDNNLGKSDDLEI